MTRANRAAAIAALVGAVLWVTELVLVVLTDGEAAGGDAARWLQGAGWILVVGGAVGVGGGLARGRQREVQVGAMVAGPLLAWLSITLLGMLGEAVVPSGTPEHVAARFDTGLGALLWATLAIWALDRLRERPRRTPRHG